METLNDENLDIQLYRHTESKTMILDLFLEKGWAYHPEIFTNKSNYFDLLYEKTILHVQFGHQSQIYFNILGASHKFTDKTIDVIVYILPSKTYAFGNRVQFDKLIRQYDEFSKFLTVPTLFLEVE